jgi:uncharacterized membrane protein SirB2
MDETEKLKHQLEQEKINSENQLRQERLKRAEDNFTHRGVFTSIIFLIIFVILVFQLEGTSSGAQWFWLILFFGAAFVALGLICRSYNREKDEARKEK